ncbi:cell wall-binding repeat-containing protein [Bacillus suaedae]|uniref:Cell wall-binding repeat-containing protein n=1 Tax=Halalkalibacter suaedae TaxID=2822140 RepID=A0A940WY98_9BACI|nr:cell wall-binding repeat-containing protein [Bacillus suaedae]MBP3950214.1 cell wall-binding repeat-containing protein [Bacillus suaedae]
MRQLIRVLLLCSSILLLFPASSFAEKVLVIDPGHGGKFSGTCGATGNRTGFCEKEANLKVSLKVRDILKSSDITVHLTRSTDKEFASYLRKSNGSTTGGDFDKRMQIANNYAKGNNDNSLFISVHHNASPTSPYLKGTETYYYDGVNHYKPEWPHDPMQIKYLSENKRFAEIVQPRLVKRLGTVDRKVRNNQSFFVIRNAQMPAVLLELGFMTNREEESRIKTNDFQQKAAQAIADSVINYFKVFEVFDAKGKKLAIYKNQTEAVNYAKTFKTKVTVFDKNKQKTIFTNQPNFIVEHKENGILKEYYTENEAINYASGKTNTRVRNKVSNWTVWSNFLKKKYDVYEGTRKIGSYYDYNQAVDVAKSKSNVKIVNTSTNAVVWSNNQSIKVTRQLIDQRVSGKERYLTAVEVSKSLYPNGFETEKEQKIVILATGGNAADALAAGPLSKLYGKAPILLTEEDTFTSATLEEIIRLQADKVVIIGGTKAVPAMVEDELQQLEIETVRISGSDRYETSLRILEALGEVNGIFVASGTSFPDALSVAPIAAANNWGIVLTEKYKLPEESFDWMNAKPVMIVGGTAVVSNSVEQSISAYNAKNSLKRLSGKDRYQTLVAVVNSFKNNLNMDEILVTTGTNFPDALASAPLAIGTQSPLIIVNTSMTPSVQMLLMENGDKIGKITTIGGTNAVNDKMIESIKNSIR